MGIPCKAFYSDPATGRRFDQGTIQKVADHPRPFEGHTTSFLLEDSLEDSGSWEELGKPSGQKEAPSGVATEKGKACLTNMVSVHRSTNEKDVMVSMEAGNHAEAGIILGFHDLSNYIVAPYSPPLKAIHFFERGNGAVVPFFTYRIPHLGMVDVPEIGPTLTLTAAACGDYVAMSLDDGARTYPTQPVRIDNVESGQVGLWRSDIGEAQRYANFKVSKTTFAAPDEDEVQEGLYQIRSGEDIAPSIPSPQDWVLVLEGTSI